MNEMSDDGIFYREINQFVDRRDGMYAEKETKEKTGNR